MSVQELVPERWPSAQQGSPHSPWPTASANIPSQGPEFPTIIPAFRLLPLRIRVLSLAFPGATQRPTSSRGPHQGFASSLVRFRGQLGCNYVDTSALATQLRQMPSFHKGLPAHRQNRSERSTDVYCRRDAELQSGGCRSAHRHSGSGPARNLRGVWRDLVKALPSRRAGRRD